MKQLTHKLKDGQLDVLEVPAPLLSEGQVLVRNHFSVISAGTEGSTVSTGRKGYVGKAKERPQQAKQVIDSVKTKGVVQTYRAVMKKLDAYSPLGYSCAGEVVEVATGVTEFASGDMVACAGAGYANHAELVAVPVNLCVKLPDGARLDLAAYNTVGSISMQGVRQAELNLGETCIVIGLGLIGQLACLLLRASGVTVIGVDIDPGVLEIAGDHCLDAGFLADDVGLASAVMEATDGIGADAAIIAAASKSDGPVNLAGELLKKRGKVVILGRVPTGFDFESYYKKELDLRMSCSYGPGRYDPSYEEGGLDYPAGYVRWTENRNMRAFQELVHSSRIDIEYLSTHTFALDDAPQAYELILKGEEPHLGVVLEYDVERELDRKKIATGSASTGGKIGVAFIGAGSYAMGSLLPNIKASDVSLKTVMTSHGTSSRSVGERYGFESCTADENDVWSDTEINTVFITTRHNSHAEYVLRALKAGKNVFVEKPLSLTLEELEEISGAYRKLAESGGAPSLMVGFNRRFSPLTTALKDRLGEGPMSMVYRVNAGSMERDHWMQMPDVGGGRIIGEACHFIDYLTFMNGSLPVEVSAAVMDEPDHLEDTVNMSLRFANGSVGTVSYFANGSPKLPKEYVEIHRGGQSGVLSDYTEMTLYGRGKPRKKRLPSQNKGQPEMMKAYLDSLRQGARAPIPFEDIYAVM
ncbi:MAG: bi-domain-containing oxidoreductase, partial [Candidatus Eisenbacteria sp.]|nr:bi-domain-containing oxidoreductase [Candidatus Eisenbacteria bacterium]